MPPARRVAIAMEMSDGIRDIALAGIRARHPELSEKDDDRPVRARELGRGAERVNGQQDILDLVYRRGWAHELGIRDALERILAEVGTAS